MIRRGLNCSLVLFSSIIALTALAGPREVRVGYVADGPYYLEQDCWEQFKKEMIAFEDDEFRFIYPAEYQLIDNWDPDIIKSNCGKVLNTLEIDIVIGMGLGTSSFFVAQTDLKKPVLLFGDLDFELLAVYSRSHCKGGRSGSRWPGRLSGAPPSPPFSPWDMCRSSTLFFSN